MAFIKSSHTCACLCVLSLLSYVLVKCTRQSANVAAAHAEIGAVTTCKLQMPSVCPDVATVEYTQNNETTSAGEKVVLSEILKDGLGYSKLLEKACDDAKSHPSVYFPSKVVNVCTTNDISESGTYLINGQHEEGTHVVSSWTWIRKWIEQNYDCMRLKDNFDKRRKTLETVFLFSQYVRLRTDGAIAMTGVKTRGLFLQVLNHVVASSQTHNTSSEKESVADFGCAGEERDADFGNAEKYANCKAIMRLDDAMKHPNSDIVSLLGDFLLNPNVGILTSAHKGRINEGLYFVSASLSLQDCAPSESAMGFYLGDDESLMTGFGADDQPTLENIHIQSMRVITPPRNPSTQCIVEKMTQCRFKAAERMKRNITLKTFNGDRACFESVKSLNDAYRKFTQKMRSDAGIGPTGKEYWPMREMQVIFFPNANVLKSRAYLSRELGYPSFPPPSEEISRDSYLYNKAKIRAKVESVTASMRTESYAADMLRRVHASQDLNLCVQAGYLPGPCSWYRYGEHAYSGRQIRFVPAGMEADPDNNVHYLRINPDTPGRRKIMLDTRAELESIVSEIRRKYQKRCEPQLSHAAP